MARRKSDQALLEDIFADMAHEEQSETLRVLTRLHEITERKAKRSARSADKLEARGSGVGTVKNPPVVTNSSEGTL